MTTVKITPPATGEKITVKNGKLAVPDHPIIPFIEGDGTGADIWRASVRVLDAAVAKAYGGKRKISWMEVYAGEKANNLMETLQNKYGFGFMAVSLGYFDTLMSCPGSSTSSEMTDEDLAVAGIGGGLVRMAVGYTGSIEQRWQQLESALKDIGACL